MIEIRWHARAGQGAVTAAKALADAALAEGKYIQAFPDYGPERMGAPIKAYNRISERPIRMRGIIENPMLIVVIDPSLLGPGVLEGAVDDAVYVINTTMAPDEVKKALNLQDSCVFTVDANRIAMENIGLRKPNTPMLGALVRASGIIGIDTLISETEKSFGKKYKDTVVQGNLAAIRAAYEEVYGGEDR